MKKLAGRLLVGVTILIILVCLAGWLGMRASLPQLDGELAVSGLVNAASIQRDASGIPIITANDREDLAFATGFAHAQDRFFQMDMIRRQAAGELSEIVGPVAIDIDKRYRFHRFRTRAQQLLAASPKADRDLMQRYADGVNAGLQSLQARPFEYFVLGVKPQPWKAEDSLLAVFAMFVQLNDSDERGTSRFGTQRSSRRGLYMDVSAGYAMGCAVDGRTEKRRGDTEC